MNSDPATFDAEADAAYFPVVTHIGADESVENVVIERPHGTLILDLDADGRLLGVEVLGARALLRESTLNALDPLR